MEDIEIITNQLPQQGPGVHGTTAGPKLDKDKQKAAQNPQMAKAARHRDGVRRNHLVTRKSKESSANGMDEWSTTDIDFLNKYQLLTSKPVIYVVNLTKKVYEEGEQVAQEDSRVGHGPRGGGDHIYPLLRSLRGSAQDVPEEGKAQVREGAGHDIPSLPKIIKTGFNTIHLIYFFTTGPTR